MNTRWLGLATVVVLMAVAPAVRAAEPDSVKRGRIYAQKTCADCHSIRAAVPVSPHPKAPTFVSLAHTPGMSPIALRAALQTSHKLMPNLVVRGRDRTDVVAYILSLKPRTPTSL